MRHVPEEEVAQDEHIENFNMPKRVSTKLVRQATALQMLADEAGK